MLNSEITGKENVPLTSEITNGEKSSHLEATRASILKPTRTNNLIEFSPNPHLATKTLSKVSFKNTPVRHRPPRYHVEELPPCWEELRKLDEEENWTERTSVVTKEDHQEYLESAKAFLEELIINLPCIREKEESVGKMSSETVNETPKKKTRQRFVKPVRPAGQKANNDFFIDFGLGSPPVSDTNAELAAVTEEKPKESDPAEIVPVVNSESTTSLEELNLSGKSDDGNKLQVNTGGSPKTFSPIGSERTSPDAENLTGSNEDISKLLMPHDDVEESESSQPLKCDETPLSPGHADELLQQLTSLKTQTSELADMFVSETSEIEKKSLDASSYASLQLSDKTGVEATAGQETGVAETVSEDQQADSVEAASGRTSTELGVLKESATFAESNIGADSKSDTCEVKDNAVFEDESAEAFGLTDDDFRSASDAFSLELDFLEKCGGTGNMDKLSALARQSLYVKFDPLVKGANSPQARHGQITRGDDLLQMNTPPHQMPRSLVARLEAMKREQEETSESPQGVDRLLSFSPAPKAASATTTSDVSNANTNATEPAITSTSSENSNLENTGDESNLVQPLLYCKADLEVACRKERETILAQAHEESAIREMEVQELENKLQQETKEKMKLKKDNEELKQLMLEYEKTMAEMIESGQKSQSEHDKSTDQVKKERDQIQADLNSVEAAFSDLHRRYEKLKGAIENYKKNEAILVKTTKDYQEKLKKSDEKYLMLKKHAEEKIECANVEISRVRKSYESEMAVMKAALKKEQTRCLSLDQSLQQKVNENKELTAICDELISRVGGK